MSLSQSRFKVLMVFPRFSGGSFWNYAETCKLAGAKHPAPPLGLITVAALLPDTWDIRLVDRNAETLADADIDWADLVMTGGMLPQQMDTLATVAIAQARGKRVVVGGPDATSSPDLYAAADFRVLGEAEGVIADLIAALDRGETGGLFQAPLFQVDMTTSPIPRFDLLNFSHYMHIGVQFSRGCPFLCEFCDIIELYGRRPRAKVSAQMLAELDTLYKLGYRGHVDLVDDNLIGNKKAVKAFLPDLIAWQKAHGYPFEFSTEASLNLADDDALLRMLTGAAFFAVFIGIESPDEDVLTATGKKQNTRRDIAVQIHKIYGAGLFVLAGFIVGFDEEKDNVARSVLDLIEAAAIPVCMVGLLYALPNTQLTRRLEKEGRLHQGFDQDLETGGSADQCTSGLNFETKRDRAMVLRDYRTIVDRAYTPDAYRGRVLRVAATMDLSGPPGTLYLSRLGKDLRQMGSLLAGVTFGKPALRGFFWSTLLRCALTKPKSVKPVLRMLALYVHLGPFAAFVRDEIDNQIEALPVEEPREAAG